MRLRLIALVLLVIAATAAGFVLTQADSSRDAWLVLGAGLALAAVTGALAVTTQRRMRATREVERYFTLSPEMVVVAGFDGYWKRVNPAVEAVLGYTEREALARPFMEFVHPDDRERTEEEARRVVGGATAVSFENRIACKDGSYKWIEWTATPVSDERVMYGVGRDITERRRSESEQTALRRLATLVAQEVAQSEVFSAIAEEIGRLLGTEEIRMLRFDKDGSTVVIGSSGRPDVFPLGSRHQLEGDTVVSRVLRTGRTARIDNYTEAGGPLAETARSVGVRAVVGAPILVEGRVRGAMTMWSTSDEPLPPDTESRLLHFTELMATAIASAEAREALQRLADEQAALRRVATLVAQGVPPAELFTAVTKEVAHVFSGVEPALVATVIKFDPDRECVLVGASRPYELEPIGSRWAPRELYVSTRVLRTGCSARVDEVDLESLGGPDAEVLRLRRFLHQVGSPVVVEGRLWGAMTLNSEEALPPDTDERLESFTELVATAIANAESRAEVERLADEQAALRRVATLVAKEDSPAEVFAKVAEEAGNVLGNADCVLLRDEGDGAATVVAAWGEAIWAGFPVGARIPVGGDGVVASVLREGRADRIDDYSSAADPLAQGARQRGIQSAVGCPIVVRSDIWGAIVVARFGDERCPPETEARLGQFADLVATAIANAEGRTEIERLADEQAALRRVATLVARDAPSTEVFEAVATEVGKLLDTDITVVGRYDGDGAATAIGSWSVSGGGVPAGTRSALGGHNVLTIVAETGEPARVDGYAEATGEAADIARRYGWRSSIAAPIAVEGRVWGVMLVATQRPEPFPAGSERRLAAFTDLVATAVANAQAQAEVERLADEQAALRRVATLVASGTEPVTVCRAVCNEAQALLGADRAGILRFHDDRTVTVMASSGGAGQHRVGARVSFDPGFVVDWVHETHQAARFDTDDPAAADMPEVVRMVGVRSAVGSPIVVDGELWGVITLASVDRSLPLGMERRLTDFTELVATAIANAEGRSALNASRRRIVAASDEARRRIERDLHDGTQQRLVSLGLAVRAAEASLPPERDDLRAQLSRVATGLVAAVEDLQEISRGIHPAILSKGGLAPALKALAHRSAIPVDLTITADVRLEEPIAVAAYFIASEALANAAKHSRASRIDISLEQRDRSLMLSVRDDGVGGADATRGSGLVGLTDRVEALGGSISVHSREGSGTQITAELPLELEAPQPAG